jgi:putative nucleotide binding protein
MAEKEDYAIVLDYLPNGYPLGGRMTPIAQAIGEKNLALLELVPRRGVSLDVKEKVYIGPDKRDKIYYISGRLSRDKITETAKIQLQEFIDKLVAEQEKKFVDFFNNAQPISMRLHQIELLPGFGKKHMQEILTEREKKPFKSFEDMKSRVSNLPDPKKAVEKRILQELLERERYNLFIR